MSCSEVEGLGGSGGWFEGDPCGRGLRAGGGGCAWRVRSPSWCRGSRTRGQRTGFGGRIAGASARTSMHLQHRPRLNLISRRMVVGVGRSPAGMDRCVWVNGTLASCASGSSRRCPGQRSPLCPRRALLLPCPQFVHRWWIDCGNLCPRADHLVSMNTEPMESIIYGSRYSAGRLSLADRWIRAIWTHAMPLIPEPRPDPSEPSTVSVGQ